MALAIALIVLGLVSLMALSFAEFAVGGNQSTKIGWDEVTADNAASAGLAQLAMTLQARPSYGQAGERQLSSMLGDRSSGQFFWTFRAGDPQPSSVVSINNLDGSLGSPTWTAGETSLTVVPQTAVLAVTGYGAGGNARPVKRVAIYRYDAPLAMYAKQTISNGSRIYSLGRRTAIYSSNVPGFADVRQVQTIMTSASGVKMYGVYPSGGWQARGPEYYKGSFEFYVSSKAALQSNITHQLFVDAVLASQAPGDNAIFCDTNNYDPPQISASAIVGTTPSNCVKVSWDAGSSKAVIVDNRLDHSTALPFTADDFTYGQPASWRTVDNGTTDAVSGLCYAPSTPPTTLILDGANGVSYQFPNGFSSSTPVTFMHKVQVLIDEDDAWLSLSNNNLTDDSGGGLIISTHSVNLGAAMANAGFLVSVISDGDICFCPATTSLLSGITYCGLYYANGSTGVHASGSFNNNSNNLNISGIIIATAGAIDLNATQGNSSSDFSFVYDPAVVTQQPYGYYGKLWLRRTACFTVY